MFAKLNSHRRFLRFSLRTALLFVLAIGGALGWTLHKVREQSIAVAALQRAGWSVRYDDDDSLSLIEHLRTWAGDQQPRNAHAAGGVDSQKTDAAMVHLKGLAHLQNLRLGQSEVTDAGMAHVRGLTELVDLDLAATELTDVGLAHVRGLTRVEGLTLSGTSVSDAGLAYLEPLTELFDLRLDGTRVTGAGMVHIEPLTQLYILDVANTQVTDAGLSHLTRLTKLGTLYLGGTLVTDAGLVHLRSLTQLKLLDLTGTTITDAGLVHLRSLTQLELLDLTGTKITDAGLAHLQPLANLGSLTLQETNVTDAGLIHLESLTALKNVHLYKTGVTDAGVERLKIKKPALTISRDDQNLLEIICNTDTSGRFLALKRVGNGRERTAYLTVFEHLGEGKPLRKLYETKLLNRRTPLVEMLSHDGRFFLTFNEWSGSGIGPRTAVIYDLAKNEHTAYAGRDFLSDEVIKSLPKHGLVTGFKWAGNDYEFNQDATKFYPTRPEHCAKEGLPFVVIDLPTRTVSVQPLNSVDTATLVPRRQKEWGWEASRETIATETTVLPIRMTRIGPGVHDRVLELAPNKTEYLPREGDSLAQPE